MREGKARLARKCQRICLLQSWGAGGKSPDAVLPTGGQLAICSFGTALRSHCAAPLGTGAFALLARVAFEASEVCLPCTRTASVLKSYPETQLGSPPSAAPPERSAGAAFAPEALTLLSPSLSLSPPAVSLLKDTCTLPARVCSRVLWSLEAANMAAAAALVRGEEEGRSVRVCSVLSSQVRCSLPQRRLCLLPALTPLLPGKVLPGKEPAGL